MNKPLLGLTLIIIFLSACKKDSSTLINPGADFTINGDTSHSFTIGTYNEYSLVNNSSNANSFIWDLGNGITSEDKEIVLTYPKSGNYKVTLTAINKNGKKSVLSKNIKVVDAVMKQVVIKRLDLNSGYGRPTAWPIFTKANVWVEIVKGEPNKDYPVLANGSFDAPVIYKSRIASNIDSSSVPIVFNIPKIVLDIPTLTGKNGYNGIGYGFNLYARDATGTYLLSSTFWSGGGNNYRGSIPQNWFTIGKAFLGSSFTFNGDYE